MYLQMLYFFLNSLQLILSQTLVFTQHTVLHAEKDGLKVRLENWKNLLGHICKCKQLFWTVRNSFFHKLYLYRMWMITQHIIKNRCFKRQKTVWKPVRKIGKSYYLPLKPLTLCDAVSHITQLSWWKDKQNKSWHLW